MILIYSWRGGDRLQVVGAAAFGAVLSGFIKLVCKTLASYVSLLGEKFPIRTAFMGYNVEGNDT